MSISLRKTSAYSEDLRWRMVWQREALGLNLKTVASNLGVDPSTVSRVVRLFRDTGSVEKRPYPKNSRPNKKLSMPVQLTILHTVLQYPGIYFEGNSDGGICPCWCGSQCLFPVCFSALLKFHTPKNANGGKAV